MRAKSTSTKLNRAQSLRNTWGALMEEIKRFLVRLACQSPKGSVLSVHARDTVGTMSDCSWLSELVHQLGCLSSRKTWESGALKARGLVGTHVGGIGTGSLLGSLPSSSSRIFWGYLPCARPCAKNIACLFSYFRTWNGLGVLSLSSERKIESQSGVET